MENQVSDRSGAAEVPTHPSRACVCRRSDIRREVTGPPRGIRVLTRSLLRQRLWTRAAQRGNRARLHRHLRYRRAAQGASAAPSWLAIGKVTRNTVPPEEAGAVVNRP